MTRRREFILALAGAAAAWPLAARAQQPDRMRRMGVLMPLAADDPVGQARIAALREGLEKLGWTEGRNIRIDTRWMTTGDVESMQRFAKELVALQPDLILTQSTPITATMLQETRTIPIVFALVADPIGSGFVASFPRPGGNVTGFVTMEPAMAGKWLELLKEIAPRVARVAFLFNPATATYFEYWLNPFKATAASFVVEAITAPVRDTSELEAVIAAQARKPNGGLIVMPDTFTDAHRVEITSLAARRIMGSGQCVHDPAPDANEAVVASGVRTKVIRQVAPRCTGPQDPEDAIEDTTVIYPRHAARFVGQHRLAVCWAAST
jgi:putative ABC transport system substrate-binding protein